MKHYFLILLMLMLAGSPALAQDEEPDQPASIINAENAATLVLLIEWGEYTGAADFHEDVVYDAVFLSTDDERQVITASQDRTLKHWQLPDGDLLRTFEGHTSTPTSLDVSPDGLLLASTDLGSYVSIRDMDSGELLMTLDHALSLEARFSPDGSLLVSGDISGNLKWWDTATWSLLHTTTIPNARLKDIHFSPDGDYLLTNGAYQEIVVLDTASYEQISLITPDDYSLNDVALSPDGSRLAWAGTGEIGVSGDEGITIQDMSDGTVLHHLEHPAINRIDFSPDGSLIASGDKNGGLMLWDAETGDLLHSIEMATVGEMLVLEFSPDGSLLLTTGINPTLKFWGLPQE